MKSWDLNALELRPHTPEILESGEDGRAILLELPAGKSLDDHQVHEHAWITVLSGEIEIITSTGERVSGREGLLVRIPAGERHVVHAFARARLLLLLAPWPGDGHPGAMSLADKQTVRQRALEQDSR